MMSPVGPSQRVVAVSATLWIASLAGFLGPAGCAGDPQPVDTTRAPAAPARDPLPASEYANVVVFDGLEHHLVLDEPEVREATLVKPFRIRVPIRSIADEPLVLQYRALFYDSERRPIGSEPHWQDLVIPPRAKRHIARTSAKDDTAEWVIEIRRRPPTY